MFQFKIYQSQLDTYQWVKQISNSTGKYLAKLGNGIHLLYPPDIFVATESPASLPLLLLLVLHFLGWMIIAHMIWAEFDGFVSTQCNTNYFS